MTIQRPDFAFATARLAVAKNTITMERGTGFEREAHFATQTPPPDCDRPDYYDPPAMMAHSSVLSEQPTKGGIVPKNARVVRLRLRRDHQIDPRDSIVIATSVDHATASRYRVDGVSVTDSVVDVMIQDEAPDIDAPEVQARVDVLVFRVGTF